MSRGFVDGFLLPLVKGGTLHVGRPIGRKRLERELETAQELALVRKPVAPRPGAAAAQPTRAVRELQQHRWRVASTLLPDVPPPPLDEVTLRLGHAVHDLLSLLHPALEGGPTDRRQMRIAAAAAELADVGSPPSAEEAVNRHSLLSRLDDIARSDHTVRFWVGRQRFIGRPPPPRLVALPRLRNVRIETVRRAWLREIGVPVSARPALLALHLASPLGEALDPLRLDPSPSWARIIPALRFPSLARIVAGRIVDLGVDAAGGALAGALFRFASGQEPAAGQAPTPEAAVFAIRFLAHTVWLDELCTPAEERRASGPGSPGGAAHLASLLAAAEAVDPALVWPRDLSRESDLGRRFAARLARYGTRADAAGDQRRAAALALCRFAVTGASPTATSGIVVGAS